MRQLSYVNIQLNLQFNHEYVFMRWNFVFCHCLNGFLPLLIINLNCWYITMAMCVYVCVHSFLLRETISIKFIAPLEALYILINVCRIWQSKQTTTKKIAFLFAAKAIYFYTSVAYTSDKNLNHFVSLNVILLSCRILKDWNNLSKLLKRMGL